MTDISVLLLDLFSCFTHFSNKIWHSLEILDPGLCMLPNSSSDLSQGALCWYKKNLPRCFKCRWHLIIALILLCIFKIQTYCIFFFPIEPDKTVLDPIKEPLRKTSMKAINANNTLNYQGTSHDNFAQFFCYFALNCTIPLGVVNL